jgi:hypothetical protein
LEFVLVWSLSGIGLNQLFIKMKKLLVFSVLFLFATLIQAHAQVSAGVYQLSSSTLVSVGTDTDNKMFGEARLSTGRFVGFEGTFGYNFIQKSDVNFYSGFHLGTEGNQDGFYLGIPFGLLVKPFTAKNFGFVMEASPIFPTEYGSYFRAGLGLKYTFR